MVVANELKKTKENCHWAYRMRKETPKGTQVKEVVETDKGAVTRLEMIDDRPVTVEQRQKEDERLQHLLSDSAEQEKKTKAQKEDEKHAEAMVRALPDAFVYRYDGTEIGKSGPLLRLKFEPRPDFDPTAREAEVYRGMAGVMWVDATQLRLAKIDGTLFRDVSFGWGILGKLYRGGHFVVEQSRVAGDKWATTAMILDLEGRALIKPIVYKEREFSSAFRPLPENLDLAHGIEILRRESDQRAAQIHP